VTDLFTAALERLEALKAEEKILNEYIVARRRAQRALGLSDEARQTPDSSSAEVQSESPPDSSIEEGTPLKKRVTDNPKPADVVAAAAEVIRVVGRPLSRRQIHNALARRGVVVRGVDPIKALGTMLWRSGNGVLQQIEGRGYWLSGVAAPPLPDPATISHDDLFAPDSIDLSGLSRPN
jgi:hypothetical protein